MEEQKLVTLALEAQKAAYAPYSHFNVGAALYCGDGKVYLGANIENSSFSLCCCAERNAVFRAVNDGERDFKAIAIVGGKNHKIEKYCPPCGACRQVLTEFCKENFDIILTNGQKIKTFKLKDIMPLGFSL